MRASHDMLAQLSTDEESHQHVGHLGLNAHRGSEQARGSVLCWASDNVVHVPDASHAKLNTS